MATITRKQLLDELKNGWGMYIERFQKLSAEQQKAFLQKQGYDNLKDLLAHVIGWWDEGIPAISSLLRHPDHVSPDVDVDSFNAASVERYHSMSEQAVIDRFNELLQEWIELIKKLPEQAFDDERVSWRLHAELIGHLEEHQIAV